MSFQADIMGGGIPAETARAIVGKVAKSVTATGSTQATAFPLGVALAIVTTVPVGSGVQLPKLNDGDACTIVNLGANPLLVYPPYLSNRTINGGAANSPISIADSSSLVFRGSDLNYVTVRGSSADMAFIQSGTGAVATTVQAQLQKFVFRDNYGTDGQYNTARAALTGRMAVPSLEVQGSTSYDEAFVIRAHSSNGEWKFQKGQPNSSATHRFIINETAASPQVSGIRYERNGSGLWDLDIDTNGDFFLDDVSVSPSKAAIIAEKGQLSTAIRIKSTAVTFQRGIILLDQSVGSEQAQLHVTAANGFSLYDQTQAGPPRVVQITLGASGQIILSPSGTERARFTSGGAFIVGTTVTTNLAAGDMCLKNTGRLMTVNGAGTGNFNLLSADSSNVLVMGDSGTNRVLKLPHVLVALGGGGTPLLNGTIGGNGPTAVNQNSWARFADNVGTTFWVPTWV